MEEIRKKAEDILKSKNVNIQDYTNIELHKIIEELNIHQIELQIQNEELKEKKDENEKARRKYFNLFDLAPVGYLIINNLCLIKELNLKAAEIFGRRKDFSINKPFVSLLEKGSMSKFFEYFELAKKNNLEKNFELDIHRNEDVRFLEVFISRFLDDDYLVTITDITERKTARQKLIESEEKYRNFVHNSLDAFTLTDEQGNITEWNKDIEDLTGILKSEAIGAKIWNLQFKMLPNKILPNEIKEGIKRQFTEFYEKGNENFLNKIIDAQIITKNQEVKYIQQIAFPIHTEKGRQLGSVVRDVTIQQNAKNEILKYNEELKSLNASKDKFFNIIAHDLKNPFSSILGFLQLLMKNLDSYDKDKIWKFVNIINNSAVNTYKLLENLLDWSRIQRNALSFNPKNLNLNTLLEEVVVLFSEQALLKKIKLNYFLFEKINIFADESLINSVLRNLISNAIKFSFPESKIDIYATDKNDFVEITVGDKGTGIDEDKLKNIFDMEKNSTQKGTANESGTGLGLIFCKEFVEKNGGEIFVESKLGEGSDFIFTVPKTKN